MYPPAVNPASNLSIGRTYTAFMLLNSLCIPPPPPASVRATLPECLLGIHQYNVLASDQLTIRVLLQTLKICFLIVIQTSLLG